MADDVNRRSVLLFQNKKCFSHDLHTIRDNLRSECGNVMTKIYLNLKDIR